MTKIGTNELLLNSRESNFLCHYRFYSVELHKVKEITGFVALDLSDPIEEEEVTLPQHLVQEYQDKIDLIALAKHTFKCSPSNREVIHSVIANKDLFDKGKFGKYPQITIHPQWSKILKNDPECRHFGELFWPPTGSVFKTLLASYPGSGSKWVMELFQLASGLGTTLRYVKLVHACLSTNFSALKRQIRAIDPSKDSS